MRIPHQDGGLAKDSQLKPGRVPSELGDDRLVRLKTDSEMRVRALAEGFEIFDLIAAQTGIVTLTGAKKQRAGSPGSGFPSRSSRRASHSGSARRSRP